MLLRPPLRRTEYHSVLLIALLAVLIFTFPAGAAITDCIDATCRIADSEGGRGTGCVFEISQGRVYVLTAAHVVGASRQVQCEFWRHGHRSSPLVGRVIARHETADVAIVVLDQAAFGDVLPPAIPVADRQFILRPGDTILSVGCAGGSWSTGFKGHVLGYREDDLYFVPGPANGRSGSAIVDAEGRQIVGVLRARSMDDSHGIATSVQRLYRLFGARAAVKPQAASGENTQCPGGTCPTPHRVLPYRHYTDKRFRNLERQPTPGSPYPTLPPVAAPQVDLHPIEQKLDRNAELIGQGLDRIANLLEEKNSESPPVPPPSPAPKEVVDEAAEQAAAAAKAQVDAVRREVQTTQEENSRLREAMVGMKDVVNKVVGDRETLRERMEARIEKVKAELGEDAGRPEIVRAYVRDLLAEKLGDPAVGMSAGKMVGAALGLSAPLAFALAAAAWLVSRRLGSKLESGEPLLVQKLFDRLGDKLDDVKDRIRDQSGPPPSKP